MKKIVLAYMPVLHQGYIDFLDKHFDADAFLIFGKELIARFDWLNRKDIRALDPNMMIHAVKSVSMIPRVSVLNEYSADLILKSKAKLVFADEEESRQVALDLFPGCTIEFDRVFLRYNKKSISEKKEVSASLVTAEEMHRRFMKEAVVEAEKSPDWWRQVGAVLVSGDKKIVAYNEHLPSNHTSYALGDPRSFSTKGVGVEITLALHAEGGIIGRALREGIPTLGARLYVTTFPCPYCANILSQTGIAELYYSDGYSMLEGESLLESSGIKIFKVV